MESSSGDKLVSFRNGDEGAFRYYYDLYYNALCLFGLRMLKEEEVAEDIVQDVFVNLWKASDRVDFTFENVPVPIHATSLFELYPGEKVGGGLPDGICAA